MRSKLRLYYAGDGRTDRVRLEMPDRGYALSFRCVAERENLQLMPIAALRFPTSIAVLLFSEYGEEARHPFAPGLTDEVAYLLSGLADIQVVARTSALHSGIVGDVPAIGRQLDADYILEGSVRREDLSVRICVQLASCLSGFCVWSQAFELKVTSVFEAQKHIASQIVSGVRSYVDRSSAAVHRLPARSDDSAHALYSEGRMLLNSRTQDGIHQSIACFRKLISNCPQFALAYAGLADAYSLGARYDVFPHRESWQRARLAALDAVRIDFSLSEAHTSLGFVDLHYGRNWSSAEREFCTAILLNPGYAPARQWYGWLLAATGEQEMAVTAVRQAVTMDPLSPNANADLALALYFARQYDEALAQCQKTLDLKPGFYRAHQLAGLAHLQSGRHQQALRELQAAVELTKGVPRGSALLASALAAMGKMEEARLIFAHSIETRRKASAMEFALFFAAMGDLDRVFEQLECAYVEQDSELLWLSVDPLYDEVRKDPRFPAFLSRMGSPPAHRRLHDVILSKSVTTQLAASPVI